MHGAADGAPGLYVDRYADLLVVHADSEPVLDTWRHALPAGGAAIAKIHARQANRTHPVELRLWGHPPDELTVTERGAHYLIRPQVGLNVGLFLDMREVRSWLRQHSAGRTVLNLFAYTCAFGVVASLGGARRVLNLDLAKGYLEWGKANYAANGLATDDHDFVYGDALDWLQRFVRRHEHFDVVVVDPPSFSTSGFSVERDYARLVSAAARVTSPGGMLLAATNHASTTDNRFEAWLRSGLDSAGRRGQLEQRWHEPAPDFPLVEGQHPHLKVRALTLD
ncbi:MAG TPA: class I SAM-dependent methyltransferase [Chloroflexota bacterium]